MDCSVIDGALFRQLLQAGFNALCSHEQDINDLNVFPVPDGDTGTNMRLTFANGLHNIKEEDNLGKIASEFSVGMLYGARGNSGVLSSRYFFGLAKGLEGRTDIDVKGFASAMVKAYEAAYKAVDDPAEGTILTVAREGIDTIKDTIDYENITFLSFLGMVVQTMSLSLDNTPNLLPILKESGVVDSGGKGLLIIFQGFLSFFTGDLEGTVSSDYHETASVLPSYDFSLFNEDSVLEYGYCTEFLLQLQTSKTDVHHFDLSSFISFLSEHGSSLICFQNGTVIKVHIHTKKPYEIIEFAQRFGEFLTFKMENMSLQHNNVEDKKAKKNQERKQHAIITIAQGEGLLNLFKEIGADVVLNGHDTMNTSSAELIDAFKEANADEIIVLPNEKNILMAAHQAAELYKDSTVRVLETRDIPSGYAAMTMLMGDEETADQMYDAMKGGLDNFTSGFICQASRDTTADGIVCVKGSYIQGLNGHLVGCDETLEKALISWLNHVEGIEDKEVLTLMFGKSVDDEKAEHLISLVKAAYPRLEIGRIDGRQAVYDVLLGIN